jgi:cysteine desulfurase
MRDFFANFGNPSSSHQFGTAPNAALKLAKQQVASLISSTPEEICFCSCASESVNHVIKGVVSKFFNSSLSSFSTSSSSLATGHIITSTSEHVVVLEVLSYLEKVYSPRLSVTRLLPMSNGIVNPEDVANAVQENTLLVTLMHANNEIGAVNDIAKIVETVKSRCLSSGFKNFPLFHVDASQSVGKIPVDCQLLQCDFLTIAGHKLYAPKGIGATYIRASSKNALEPLLHGASQEGGRRAGTENVLYAVALGAAAAEAKKMLDLGESNHLRKLRDRLAQLLIEGSSSQIAFNGPLNIHYSFVSSIVNNPSYPSSSSSSTSSASVSFLLSNEEDSKIALPNTLSVGFAGALASEVVKSLASTVACSAGAACHSEQHATISHVLTAMKVERSVALGTLRLSLGRSTTLEDIEKAAPLILSAVKQSREKNGNMILKQSEGASHTAVSLSLPSSSPVAPPLPPVPGFKTDAVFLQDTYKFCCSGAITAVLQNSPTGPLYNGNTQPVGPSIAGFPTVLVLDRTVAHAQGGGQPADRGVIVIEAGLNPIEEPALLFTFRAVRWGIGVEFSDSVLHYGELSVLPQPHLANEISKELANEISKESDDSSLADIANAVGELPKGGSGGEATSTGTTLPALSIPSLTGRRVQVRINSVYRSLTARLHSAGHLLDLAMKEVLPLLFKPGENVPVLKGGKGYHFPDAPSVEYDGAVPPEKREELVPSLNKRLKELINTDNKTSTWILERGKDDSKIMEVLCCGPDALSHYGLGKTVRIVAVGSSDNVCPCGGTHVEKASTLVSVTVTKVKVTKGQTKLSYVIE